MTLQLQNDDLLMQIRAANLEPCNCMLDLKFAMQSDDKSISVLSVNFVEVVMLTYSAVENELLENFLVGKII